MGFVFSKETALAALASLLQASLGDTETLEKMPVAIDFGYISQHKISLKITNLISFYHICICMR